jgi:hypothetical protein
MLIWAVFGLWGSWPVTAANAKPMAGNLFLFILLVILGWRVFGAPVHQ